MNIAEILKDCPKGTKLYSPLCGECTFDRLNMGTIICKKQNTQEITFTREGYYMLPVFDGVEPMIFPSKENRDWGNFQRPFKDGDIIYIETYNFFKCISIFKRYSENQIYSYVDYCLNTDTYYHNHPENILTSINNIKYKRIVTEEEKQKLFDAIKANGYKWNAETKTFEEVDCS